MATQVKAHPVTVAKIVSVEPLVTHGKTLSPEAGLLLVLDNGTKHQWFSEKAVTASPVVGDFLITDPDLNNLIYFVRSETFAALFSEV
jgi:hypothetical protein